MNYKLISFIAALMSVAVLLPLTFFFNAKEWNNNGVFTIIYLAVTAVIFLMIFMSRSAVWHIIFEQIGRIMALCTAFLFVMYASDEGDSFISIDGFWAGVLLWFIATVILSACGMFVVKGVLSIFYARTWEWPANIINNLAYAVFGLYICLGTFVFAVDVCPLAGFLSLLSLIGSASGAKEAKDNGEITMTDEYGHEVKGRKFGDRFIASEGGAVYRQRNDNQKWERID